MQIIETYRNNVFGETTFRMRNICYTDVHVVGPVPSRYTYT